MIFYADYEALEFNSKEAYNRNIYPYYLDSTYSETSLCPIYLSVSNKHGNIVDEQDCMVTNISFLKLLDKLIKKKKGNNNIQIWFHNIRYDFRIILHELFYNGFVNVIDNSEYMNYREEYPTIVDKSFALLGKNLSDYIGVNIYYKNCKILLRDTMRILNSSQNKILKAFNFSSKVDVDWDSINIDNLDKHMSLIRERCNYDVVSLALAIEQFKYTFITLYSAEGRTAPSISLDAFCHYLVSVENPAVNKKLVKPNKEYKNSVFKNYYNVLRDDAKTISSLTYHGGICTYNYTHLNKVVENIQMLDINSSYPYAMTQPLPYGEGIYIKDFTNIGYSDYVVYIKFDFKDNIPFQRCHSECGVLNLLDLPIKKIYSRSQFPKKFEGHLAINSIDLDTLCSYSHVKELEFVKGVNYNTNTILKDFILKLYNQRKKSEGVERLAIKLILNSLYGKFAQDLSGFVFLYDSIQSFRKIFATDTNSFYKPLASAVTAYARKRWVEMVNILGKDFIYGDTDSVYFFNPENNLKKITDLDLINTSELGKWSMEYEEIIRGKFLSKKNYILEYKDNEGIKKLVKCVGLSHNYHKNINFDNFVLDSEVFNVKKMVQIYGGLAMRDTIFKIRERVI